MRNVGNVRGKRGVVGSGAAVRAAAAVQRMRARGVGAAVACGAVQQWWWRVCVRVQQCVQWCAVEKPCPGNVSNQSVQNQTNFCCPQLV